jgi:hypothetical protein
VIGDVGRQFPVDKAGIADSGGDFEKVVLTHGTFLLDERALTNGHWYDHTNRSNCSSTIISQHPVGVLDGTGAYAGIKGSIAGVGTVAILPPRITSGKRKGQCGQEKGVGPRRHVSTMDGSGFVTL